MMDAPDSDSESGETAEFSAVDSGRSLPALATDFRDHLPGLEPERRVTDWGRSERVEGAVDRVLYDFLYHYWFRVEVEGIENVPDEGGALLVCNHSGAVPCDSPMLAKAIREEHPRPRPVHLGVGGSLAGVPGLGMVVTKLGGVASHPANLHRLLLDDQELVVLFPEGPVAAKKPVGQRYLLRSFDEGFVDVAAKAGVPIVPVSLLGAEEAAPLFARLRAFGPLGRVRLPVTTPLPLPAKFRIRFLEPVWPEEEAPEPAGRAELASDIRALIQENLLEMVGGRRSVWLG